MKFVFTVRHVLIPHKDHFVNIARRRTSSVNELGSRHEESNHVLVNGTIEKGEDSEIFPRDCNGGFFADQFENLANFRSHYEGTGPEIWEQTNGKLHAFVAAAGTGGTIAGVSRFLEVTRGVMYRHEEAEGRRLKNPFDTITEGIGINRFTKNFAMAKLDGAFKGSDKEDVEMSRFLLKNDGLFVGSSSAMNCVGAVQVAQTLDPGHTIVTILCDNGIRHLSKFHNPEFLLIMA